jgi:DNA invertase Pin-like site-specific DNA recombinase
MTVPNGRSAQQGLDTSTPSGRAMFQMMGVFAEFERAMIRERSWQGLPGRVSKGRNPAADGSRIRTRRRLLLSAGRV